MANIKKGANGSSVKKLQAKLNTFKAGLLVDGIFGPKTDEAVRKFQKSSGLKVDGIVGVNTQAMLDLKLSGGNATGGKKPAKASGGKGILLPVWPDRDYDGLKATYKITLNDMIKAHLKSMSRKDKILKVYKDRPKSEISKVEGLGLTNLLKTDKQLKKTTLDLEHAFLTLFDGLDLLIAQSKKYRDLSKGGKALAALDVIKASVPKERDIDVYLSNCMKAEKAFSRTGDLLGKYVATLEVLDQTHKKQSA